MPDFSSDATPIPYLHSPAISPDGSQVAFVYAGDIYLVDAQGGEAELLTSHPGYDDRPHFSPDGRRIAFTSFRTGNGDLYIVDLDGGEVVRLTYHDMTDIVEDWSPDGQILYFTSNRDCLQYATFRVSVEGGTPVCLFGDPYEAHYNLALSPNGMTLAFNNNGDPWWRRGPNPSATSDIWLVSARVGATDFRKLPVERGKNLRPMWHPHGQGLYFMSDRDGHENIWYLPLEGKEAEQITHFQEGRLLRPNISRDGRWIVFDRDFRIWRLSLETRTAAPIPIRVRADQKTNPVTHYVTNGDLREFELSPDGKKIAYVVRGKIFADFAEKEEKPKNFSFKVSDTSFRESQVLWSPDSKKAVYLSDRDGENQLFLYDFTSRQETRLTDSPEPKGLARFSSDGKWLAFFQRPDEIRLMSLGTKEIRPFIKANFFFEVASPSFAWSPDSKWIAFTAQDDRWFTNVYVQSIEESTPHPITFLGNIGGGGVLWSPNGKFIIFTTGHYRMEAQIARVDLTPVPPSFREADFEKLFEEAPPKEKKEPEPPKVANLTPQPPSLKGRGCPVQAISTENPLPPSALGKEGQGESGPHEEKPRESPEKPSEGQEEKKIEPVTIVWEGLKDRLRFLTPFQWNASATCISPDSKTLIFQAAPTGQIQLFSLSLEEEKQGDPPTLITSTTGYKWGACFTPDGKKLYYVDDGKVIYRDFPKGDPKTLETRAEYDVNFHEEKKQIFREAWNLIRDHFYDPGFHGCDWSAVGDRLWPVASGVRTQEELHELLNLMVGELNASHLGVGGGGSEVADGYLGLSFDQAEMEATGHLKVSFVLPHGPCAIISDPVQTGEYLLAIDGQPVNAQASLDSLLHRTPGKRVMLTLNTEPQMEGARQAAVRPIARWPLDGLVYRNWVRENAAYVDRVSCGRLGYVHIRAMSYECYQQFLVDLDTETHSKEGVVIDVRFNGGGHIAPFILDVLQRRRWDITLFRGRAATNSTNLAGNRILDKPTVLITNEHSGSNTEMFSEGYRRLGLGKVVGKPTAGAVIWTWGWQFLDNSWFRLPRLQVATLEGEDLETAARPVDVEADRPLGEALQGRDTQLDAAVRTLLGQIGKES